VAEAARGGGAARVLGSESFLDIRGRAPARGTTWWTCRPAGGGRGHDVPSVRARAGHQLLPAVLCRNCARHHYTNVMF
jgi:hypothetical protein